MNVRAYSSKQQKLLGIQTLILETIRHEQSEIEKPISQRALARLLRVSQPTTRSLERGDKPPGRLTMCRLSKLMSDKQVRVFLDVLELFDTDDVSDTDIQLVEARAGEIFRY